VQVAWFPDRSDAIRSRSTLEGDLTLKRRLVAVIDDLEAEGLTRELGAALRIAPIDTTLR